MVLEIENKGIENKYVLFKLDEEYYGLSIENVLSIEKFQSYTRAPNAPDYVIGLINLRGEVVPIVDLRKKLSLEAKESGPNTRIIVTSFEEIVVGLMVDSSSEVLEINHESIDKPSTIREENFREYIKGIAKGKERLIVLLDLERLLEQ